MNSRPMLPKLNGRPQSVLDVLGLVGLGRLVGLGGLLLASALGLAGCAGHKANLDAPDGLSDSLPVSLAHNGPAVAPGGVTSTSADARFGAARFVGALHDRFDRERAMGLTAFADRHYRDVGSDGYERVVDRVVADLYAAGFGTEAGFGLEVIKSGLQSPTWTPRSAVIELVRVDARGAPIQAIPVVSFDGPDAPERALLPAHAPGCELVGPLADGLDELTAPGMILLTDRRIRGVEQEARERGAVAIVSAYLLPYCVDPTGRERHLDAIFLDSVRAGSEMPSFYVSPRIANSLRNSARVGGQVRLLADVRFAVRPLRTIVATIEGTDLAREVVHIAAHIDGAGANDNAAGLGGMVEGALLLKRLIDGKVLPRPRRSISFVFGQEAQSADVMASDGERVVLAAIVTDMIGTSHAETQSECLLERGWDPAAIVPLPPDVHTPWGEGAVAEEDLFGNGLAILLREALVDVAAYEARRDAAAPHWVTREHPWEGGSDHDRYLAEGIAACLLWHFTDFSFATSLDRIAFVDPDELRRTAVAALAGALSIADAKPTDLKRHLDSLNLERQMRLDAALSSDSGEALVELWKTWFDGARFWLQAICLGEPLPTRE